MTISTRTKQLSAALAFSTTLSLTLAVPGYAENSNQAAALASRAQSIRAEDTSKVLNATVWLKLHNKQQLDATVAKLYEKGSPTYHKWLSKTDLAKFAPTSAELETVKRELQSRNLQIVSSDSQDLSVQVRGTVADLQSAFNTRINHYVVKGKSISAATTEAKVSGPAASLVDHVGGLSGSQMEPDIKAAVNPDTNQPFAGIPVTSAAPGGIFYSGNCFLYPPQTATLTTTGAALPKATYTGNRYGANPANSQVGTLAPCGYDADDLQTAYNLKPAYKSGLNGAGQTIVIIDAFSSPTILADANTFSALNGLPQLTSSNFQIYQPGGTAPPNSGWAGEITLDVEWAHAIAPGAKIALVEAVSNYDSDLQTALAYAVSHHLGNVISNSYGEPESQADPAAMNTWNSLCEIAAASGISVHFSSGDSGDYTADGLTKTVSTPSNAPYATSVGGTTMGLNSAKHIQFQTGWGDNRVRLYSGTPKAVLDPPLQLGFYAGAGGGESAYFTKPSWQSGLPGSGRQQPDVSALADPYTGGEIIITIGGAQYVQVYGGTSLACPIFSAIFAITNQLAGHPLGQAAPLIATLAPDALIDVTNVTSATNVSGIITDSSGPHYYSPGALVAPVENSSPFYSALYFTTAANVYSMGFGTDTSLAAAPGWDNVTGFGVPNGNGFIHAAAHQ
jgi:subtilase family serine protease